MSTAAPTTQFQPGDRIEVYAGEDHAFRADVLKVAKNGRIYVERWFSAFGISEPKLVREWRSTHATTLVRRNAA